MFGSAEQDSEEYQLYEQADGTFKELQERFNKMLYDASNVSKKSGVQTEYQSGEVINDEGDLRFKVSNETADLLDRYTEKTYNDYGWIAVNDVLSKSEWSQYNRKLREALDKSTPRNYYGESVITVGEHSSDITALVYVKGTASNPIVTRVVRINSEIQNAENISDILQELEYYERQGYRDEYATIENYEKEKIFNRYSLQDFETLRELRLRLRSVGEAVNSDSGIEQNGRGSAQTDSTNIKAGVENTSAFSNGENGRRYSIPKNTEKVAKQESKNLEEENRDLKHRLHESEVEQDRLKREMTLSEFTTKDDPSVNSFAKSLRKKYGSTMSTAELHQRLNDIYYHLAKRGGVASNVISDKCLKLAEDIANTATEKRQGEFWNELREYFKDKRITLAVQDRNDMGDWQSFRKKYQQSFGLRNEGGLPVDVVYMELHEQFPGLFDDTITHPADQLREIGEVYEKLISIKVYIKRKRPVTNRSSSRAFPIHSDTQKTE